MTIRYPQIAIAIFAIFLCVLFFAFDLMMPLGVAGGIPYVVVVLLGIWLPGSRYVVGLASIVTILVVLGYNYSPTGGIGWVVFTNRALAFFAIWVSALLILQGKRKDRALKASEKRANDLASSSSDLFWETDTEHRFSRYWGTGIHRTDGEQQTLGRTRWEISGADIKADEGWRAHLEAIREHRPFRDFVYRNQRATGEIDYWSSSGTPYFDEDGAFAGYRGVGKVITDQVLAEAALKESEAKWSGMLSISPEAIIACDEKQRIVVFNQGAEKLFGYAAAEIIGRHLETLLPERFRGGHGGLVKTFAQSDTASRLMNERNEIFGLKKNGLEFPAEASISKLQLGEDMLFTVMLHDITAHKENERNILQAKEAAEVADRAKSEFLANMSHELRTPLNAIIGFSEIIKEQSLGAEAGERYRQYAGDIYDSGGLLLSIINDILDISKIEAGKVELEEENLDVNDLCRAMLALVENRAGDAGVSLAFNAVAATMVLLADQRIVRQMLLNLLSNAIKFTAAGGQVDLSLGYADDGCLEVAVTDTGIGIKPEDIATALSAFGQIGSAETRSTHGTGLGLPIVASMAELHGGGLRLESEIGTGTTATIWFPKERVIGGET